MNSIDVFYNSITTFMATDDLTIQSAEILQEGIEKTTANIIEKIKQYGINWEQFSPIKGPEGLGEQILVVPINDKLHITYNVFGENNFFQSVLENFERDEIDEDLPQSIQNRYDLDTGKLYKEVCEDIMNEPVVSCIQDTQEILSWLLEIEGFIDATQETFEFQLAEVLS